MGSTAPSSSSVTQGTPEAGSGPCSPDLASTLPTSESYSYPLRIPVAIVEHLVVIEPKQCGEDTIITGRNPTAAELSAMRKRLVKAREDVTTSLKGVAKVADDSQIIKDAHNHVTQPEGESRSLLVIEPKQCGEDTTTTGQDRTAAELSTMTDPADKTQEGVAISLDGAVEVPDDSLIIYDVDDYVPLPEGKSWSLLKNGFPFSKIYRTVVFKESSLWFRDRISPRDTTWKLSDQSEIDLKGAEVHHSRPCRMTHSDPDSVVKELDELNLRTLSGETCYFRSTGVFDKEGQQVSIDNWNAASEGELVIDEADVDVMRIIAKKEEKPLKKTQKKETEKGKEKEKETEKKKEPFYQFSLGRKNEEGVVKWTRLYGDFETRGAYYTDARAGESIEFPDATMIDFQKSQMVRVRHSIPLHVYQQDQKLTTENIDRQSLKESAESKSSPTTESPS